MGFITGGLDFASGILNACHEGYAAQIVDVVSNSFKNFPYWG